MTEQELLKLFKNPTYNRNKQSERYEDFTGMIIHNFNNFTTATLIATKDQESYNFIIPMTEFEKIKNQK
jgi:hypothetical protein